MICDLLDVRLPLHGGQLEYEVGLQMSLASSSDRTSGAPPSLVSTLPALVAKAALTCISTLLRVKFFHVAPNKSP